MGISKPTSAIRFCRSSPLRPGSCKSNTRQLGASAPRAGQEFLRGGEGFGLPPQRPDQLLQALPDRGVVIHNRDNSVRLPRLRHSILLPGTSEG